MQQESPSSVPACIPGIGVISPAATASAAACIPSVASAPVPTPSTDPPPEPKPKAIFPNQPQLLQAMCETAARLASQALPDADLVVTFEEVLAGAAGATEQQAALAMLQDTTTKPRTNTNGDVALVYVDDGGMAPAIAINSWKQHVLHNMTVTLRSTGMGTKRKVQTEHETQQPEAARKQKTRSRKYGDCPGPMPSGWVLVRRDVDDPNRQYKRYRSPQGQMFSSYGQAQQHWEALGHTVVDEVPPVELEPVVAQADAQLVDDAHGMLQPVNPGQRRYLPAEYVPADDPAAPLLATHEGGVLHIPTQSVYNHLRAARIAACRRDTQLCYLPPGTDFGPALDWFRELARGPAVADPPVSVLSKAPRSKGRKSSPSGLDEQSERVEVVQRVQAALTELARLSLFKP